MEKIKLAQEIFEHCYLKGDFTLRSGLKSKEYFDKYLMESSPFLLKTISDYLYSLIPEGTEVLAGLEMGGIPIVSALSLRSNIPSVFVRKKAKEYGTKKTCEGIDIKGKKICIIEDVITTGGQVIQSTKDLRREGAEVENVLCVIFRGEDLSIMKKNKLNVSYLFTKEEIVSSKNK